ncbi:MAG: TIGR01777 family oxidoreductase [Planctomycetaceae bacterium]
MTSFEKQSTLPFPTGFVFDWHECPGAFARLTPPWERVELISQTGGIRDGDRVELRVSVGPFWKRWVAEHRDYQAGQQFRDVQIQGPFAKWDHTHIVSQTDDRVSVLLDRIEYRLPFGLLGRLFGSRLTQRKLNRVFAYRHRTTRDDLHAHWKFQMMTPKPLRILVTGSSGLVGSNLIPFLTGGGHTVCRLVRSKNQTGDDALYWNPKSGEVDAGSLEGFDAVVHLAGENIASGRWTQARKARIRDSRVEGTRLLAEALASLKNPPKVLVCASAIGYYGDRGDEELTEQSPPGEGFLSDVCQEWEAAANPAREAGIRVAHMRFGVILSPRDGALKKMLLPFKMGVGGILGNGRQYWSWIGIDDVIGSIHHAIGTESLEGPVNAVSPQPVTNREFTKTLGRVLKRPTIFPMPGFVAKTLLGEMAEALLLSSARVLPNRLMETNYEFRHSNLEDCLRHLLGR